MIVHRPFAPRGRRNGCLFLALVASVLAFAQPGFAGEVWPVGGVRVSPLSVSSQLGKVVSDDAGGVIIAYSHNVGVASIMVTRVNAGGLIEWGPVEVCPSAYGPSDHVITTDGVGGAIIAWEDHRIADERVYAQRINGAGLVLWPAGGISVSSQSGWQVNPEIATDGTGGAIIVWKLAGLSESSIHGQRVLADGSFAPGWNPATGVAICAVDNETSSYYSIASDGRGGVVVSWEDSRTLANDAVFANLVGSDGAVLWATNGVVVASTEDIDYRQTSIVSDGAGGAIVSYVESTWYTDEEAIHAHRIDDAGQTQWDSVLCAVAEPDSLDWSWAASDGDGGAVVAWRHRTGGSGPVDVRARRVTNAGATLWPNCGVQVSALGGAVNTKVSIAPDGNGGAILTWYDRSDGWYVLAQHINGVGDVMWPVGGLDLDPGADHPHGPVVMADGQGGGLFAWEGDCAVWCVYAQRVISDVVFKDGFESGTVSAWSVTVFMPWNQSP